MATFLSLCFSWTFFVALGILFVVAFLDIVYREGDRVMFNYPERPKIQVLVLLLLAAVFVLWQTPVISNGLVKHLPEILILRLVLFVAWIFVARFLIKWLIRGLAFLIIHSILNDFTRAFNNSEERLT